MQHSKGWPPQSQKWCGRTTRPSLTFSEWVDELFQSGRGVGWGRSRERLSWCSYCDNIFTCLSPPCSAGKHLLILQDWALVGFLWISPRLPFPLPPLLCSIFQRYIWIEVFGLDGFWDHFHCSILLVLLTLRSVLTLQLEIATWSV